VITSKLRKQGNDQEDREEEKEGGKRQKERVRTG
jgi:hypothetical protein